MTTNHPGRGFSINKLVALAGFFLLFHVCSLVIERVRIPDISAADFGALSFVIIFEILSWAAYPILAFCFLILLDRVGATTAILAKSVALCLITELAYDFARAGSLLDLSSQTFLWAFPLCFVIYAAGEKLQGRFKTLAIVGVIFAALLWVVLGNIGVRFSGFYPGAIVIMMFLVFHYVRGRENTMMMSAALIGATCGLAPAFGVMFLHYRAPLLAERSQFPSAAWLLAFPLALVMAGAIPALI